MQQQIISSLNLSGLTFPRGPYRVIDSRERAAEGNRKRGTKLVRKKGIGFSVTTVLLALCLPAVAQQPTKVPRIGFLIASTPSHYMTRIETFRQAMRELGYVEGKNINIEYRYGEGKEERFREIAAEFVSLKVDVFVTAANARAAKNATKTIPIVFAAIGDPVASGIVDSLARPGGNLTGLSVFAPELTGKRLGGCTQNHSGGFPVESVKSRRYGSLEGRGSSFTAARVTDSISRSEHARRFR